MGDRDGGDGLRVSSGVGGVAAMLEDVESAAGALARASEELALLATVALGCAGDPYLLGTVAICPITGLAAEAALGRLVLSGDGLGPTAARIGGLGARLTLAVAGYRASDALIDHLLAMLLARAAVASGRFLGPAAAVIAVSGRGDDLLALLGGAGAGDLVLGALPEALAAAFGLPPKTVDSPQQIARLLVMTGFATGLLDLSQRVRTVTSAPVVGPTPSGVGELAQRTAALYPDSGGRAGTVRVELIQRPDGVRSWIVEIPGTQVWVPNGDNPLDINSAVAAHAGVREAAGATVLAALRERGVRPGEPVLLIGHSLGGMVAANLAADRGVRRQITITHVVTMGSPIGTVTLPDDVKVLSIEHSNDPVPWLDGKANPDDPQRVLVDADDGELPDGRQSGARPSGHDAQEYARTAARVDTSHDPTLDAWREGTEVFFDHAGAESTSWEVSGERVD